MSIPAALIWGLYGLEVYDLAIIIPSFFDLMIFCLQILCMLVFPTKERKQNDVKNE
jgi:hypothetical protein